MIYCEYLPHLYDVNGICVYCGKKLKRIVLSTEKRKK